MKSWVIMQEEAAPVLKMAQGRILMCVRRLKVGTFVFFLCNNRLGTRFIYLTIK
jgi:hypothetical protein